MGSPLSLEENIFFILLEIKFPAKPFISRNASMYVDIAKTLTQRFNSEVLEDEHIFTNSSLAHRIAACNRQRNKRWIVHEEELDVFRTLQKESLKLEFLANGGSVPASIAAKYARQKLINIEDLLKGLVDEKPEEIKVWVTSSRGRAYIPQSPSRPATFISKVVKVLLAVHEGDGRKLAELLLKNRTVSGNSRHVRRINRRNTVRKVREKILLQQQELAARNLSKIPTLTQQHQESLLQTRAINSSQGMMLGYGIRLAHVSMKQLRENRNSLISSFHIDEECVQRLLKGPAAFTNEGVYQTRSVVSALTSHVALLVESEAISGQIEFRKFAIEFLNTLRTNYCENSSKRKINIFSQFLSQGY